MLQNLHLKNLALIEEAEVNFEKGLNILTGETGAGKSIIIGSVNLALGQKTSREMLRDPAIPGLVELVFSVDHPAIKEKLKALGIVPEDDQIIMTRKIMSNRSVYRINSETVSASLMGAAASLLIDIHGQHEHQTLLSKKNHLKYLDNYGKLELAEKKQELQLVYQTYAKRKAELETANLDEEAQAREISFLEFEINEIEQASLSVGEDEVLEARYRTLVHGRKIVEALSHAFAFTDSAQENASDLIGRALKEVRGVTLYDERISGLEAQLCDLDNLVADFNRELSDYLSEMDFSEKTFQQIQERLNVLNHLKSKYGETLEKILEQKAAKEARLEQLQHYNDYRENLFKELKKQEEKLLLISEQVSSIRKKYAKTLVSDVTAALRDLNFLEVQFDMRFEKLPSFTANGIDEARFYISTNPGEPEKPLEQIASGGELSRIMLALKTVLAENDEIETLIFDEIDSGISGRTAQMVAEKMKETGKSHQIICITHLPQIAAMADSHFLIEKEAIKGETLSHIRTLKEADSIQELARMLGGVKITDTVLNSAKEMKDLAKEISKRS